MEKNYQNIEELLKDVGDDAADSILHAEDGSDERTKEVKNLETIIKLQNERERISLDKAKFEADEKFKKKNLVKDYINIGSQWGQAVLYTATGIISIKAAAEFGRLPNDGEKFFKLIMGLFKKK